MASYWEGVSPGFNDTWDLYYTKLQIYLMCRLQIKLVSFLLYAIDKHTSLQHNLYIMNP